jgi:hypothetical protein
LAFSIRMGILLMGIFLFIVILDLVRRKKFREELSLIWLVIGVSLMLSSFADIVIDPLAFRLGVKYPPALVFVLIFFMLVSAMLYFSLVVSDLKSKNKELSQKIALLEYRVSGIAPDEKSATND